jgi:hypothetical protein
MPNVPTALPDDEDRVLPSEEEIETADREEAEADREHAETGPTEETPPAPPEGETAPHTLTSTERHEQLRQAAEAGSQRFQGSVEQTRTANTEADNQRRQRLEAERFQSALSNFSHEQQPAAARAIRARLERGDSWDQINAEIGGTEIERYPEMIDVMRSQERRRPHGPASGPAEGEIEPEYWDIVRSVGNDPNEIRRTATTVERLRRDGMSWEDIRSELEISPQGEEEVTEPEAGTTVTRTTSGAAEPEAPVPSDAELRYEEIMSGDRAQPTVGSPEWLEFQRIFRIRGGQ